MDEVRIDKWLWAARCFKTRSLASTACMAGHVKLNGTSAKPAKPVRCGDRVEAVTPAGPRVLEVIALADRRGSAARARTLYVDHTPPPAEKPPVAARDRGAGRPSKRDRRVLARLRGR
jgi:ribosome-associated heat shock protein Hsp15